MTQEQIDFVTDAQHEADLAGHLFPLMAACEAALESGYGKSVLAVQGQNLFGMKQHVHPEYGTIALPTREFEGGEWKVVDADFVSYPTRAACFTDRMATLTRLSAIYPNYKLALRSATPGLYIFNVSKTWSTDPQRASKVCDIYNEYLKIRDQTEELGNG